MRLAATLAFVLLALVGCGGSGGGGKETMPCVSQNEPGKVSDLEPGKTYRIALKTNKGSFTIELDTKASPKTSASFVALARSGFFNGTCFHRIVPNFVIQGGDPTGTGTGGPGYSTVDKPPADAKYTKGVVAMAKAASEPPGTSGSQFFVVTGDDARLPPDYAILGKVVDGLDVVETIGKLGDANEQPTERVEIEDATVETG